MKTDGTSRGNRLTAYAGIRELTAEKGIKEAFNSARVMAYDGVELLYLASECALLKDQTEDIKAAIRESGIGVRCISCYADLVGEGAPYEKNTATTEAVKRCIDLAKEIGCPQIHHTLVTRLTGNRLDYTPIFQKVLPIAEELADYAESRGIEILYEPQGMIFNGLVGYSTFFDLMLARHKNVGLCLDVGNTLWVDEDCYMLAKKYAQHVRHVHLKDYIIGNRVSESGGACAKEPIVTPYRTLLGKPIKEVALGQGIIDLARVFDILTSSGYTGSFSIEDNSGADFEAMSLNAHAVVSKLLHK